jgi:excisionase family DNA binding protein
VSSTNRAARLEVLHNPPTLTVKRLERNGTLRVLGSRALLTLDEAAEVLRRPRGHVERAIRAGFLRTQRDSGRRYVTVQACRAFLKEERQDMDASARARERAAERGERPIPWDVARQRL